MTTPDNALQVSPATREHLQRGKAYLDFMMQPEPGQGISPVAGLEGALCYDTGKPGKAAAIMAGTHMNELAGFTALADFHERWLRGLRPPSGKIYVLASGHIPTLTDTFSRLLQEPPAIGEKAFLKTRARMENGANSQHSLDHNVIPIRFRDEPEAMIAANPHYRRIQKITALLSECDAGVLDIHSTSQPSKPAASPFTQAGDDENAALAKLRPVIRHMPVEYVTLIQEHNLLALAHDNPRYPQVRLPLRAFAKVHDGAVALLVECGQHLDATSFKNAIGIEQAWLHNVLQMPLPSASLKPSAHKPPVVLGSIKKLFHPGALKGVAREALSEAVLGDHYFLIHNTAMLGDGPTPEFHWSPAAKEAIAGYKREHRFGESSENRLGFYARVSQGDVLAIGLNTGHAVTVDSDGYLLMANKDPDLQTEQDAFCYMGSSVHKAPGLVRWR